MRKIRFRGKIKYTQRWIDGYLWQGCNEAYYIKTEEKGEFGSDLKDFEVFPDTVSQFTGLVDRNGKEIYEGDIIEDKNGIGVIMWFQTAWGVASYAHGYNGVKSYTAVDSFYCNEVKEWAVIGNIHDNPELLNENQ